MGRYLVYGTMCLFVFVRLKPNSITLASSELVLSWFEPDSVMEFGFYGFLSGGKKMGP